MQTIKYVYIQKILINNNVSVALNHFNMSVQLDT